MVSATLDLVAHDDARPTSSAVHLEGHNVFQRKSTQPADVIYIGTALLLATSGSTGNPKAVRLSYSGLADNTVPVTRALRVLVG
jgi:long-subunit acyl-CoA synthetase (AMP-forming)